MSSLLARAFATVLPTRLPGATVDQTLASRDQAARIAEGLCDWTQNYKQVRDQWPSHTGYHYGSPCPYHVVAEVLRGRPDPRRTR